MTNEDQIKSVYTTLINAVKAKSPDTKIICCSLTPIASNYQYEDITNELIQKVNGWIAAAAESNSVKYLDMASGLVGDEMCIRDSRWPVGARLRMHPAAPPSAPRPRAR